mgnify:FL=1
MVTLTAGAVILVTFPFSDLSKSKLRPAVVLANAGRDDWILCQVTSNPYFDHRAVSLTENSFRQGSLQRKSYARPGKLFTANQDLIITKVGELKQNVLKQIIDAVTEMLYSGFKV